MPPGRIRTYDITLKTLFQKIKFSRYLDFKFNDRETIGLKLDIYIPSLKLAFEINGVFHRKNIFGKLAFINCLLTKSYIPPTRLELVTPKLKVWCSAR